MLGYGIEPVNKPGVEIEVLGRFQFGHNIFRNARMEDDGSDVVVLALNGDGVPGYF